MKSSDSPIRRDLISGVVAVLRPLIQILLRSGLGFAEFNSIAKSLFVEAATQEFGLRGRPTNISRVASIVGLSRREVRKIRDIGTTIEWNPSLESSPINNLIHFWNWDRDFSVSPGQPKPLSTSRSGEFSRLARRYARDVPASVLKKELLQTGTAILDHEGRISLVKRHFQPDGVSADILSNILFALQNHAWTASHNHKVDRLMAENARSAGTKKFERSAWTTRLMPKFIEDFEVWVNRHGQEFLERADDWIGSREDLSEQSRLPGRTVGVGVYFFDRPSTNNNHSDEKSDLS